MIVPANTNSMKDDATVRAIELLSAVLVSGCYYVGSRK